MLCAYRPGSGANCQTASDRLVQISQEQQVIFQNGCCSQAQATGGGSGGGLGEGGQSGRGGVGIGKTVMEKTRENAWTWVLFTTLGRRLTLSPPRPAISRRRRAPGFADLAGTSEACDLRPVTAVGLRPSSKKLVIFLTWREVPTWNQPPMSGSPHPGGPPRLAASFPHFTVSHPPLSTGSLLDVQTPPRKLVYTPQTCSQYYFMGWVLLCTASGFWQDSALAWAGSGLCWG